MLLMQEMVLNLRPNRTLLFHLPENPKNLIVSHLLILFHLLELSSFGVVLTPVTGLISTNKSSNFHKKESFPLRGSL
jgi:hypothetical protein